jgi:acetoin utilization deacetylase AcuC-like enzyme
MKWHTASLDWTIKGIDGLPGRIVSTLEGGYALDALARSTVEHVRCLMGV